MIIGYNILDMITNWKKNIILFLASQTLSLFGSSLVQYAIMWYITLTTQSGVMMTVYFVFGLLPTFFLSPIAGVWADRYNRKTLIALSDSVIAVSTLILAVLFLLGYNAIWLLFVASAIRAFGAGVQTPTVGAFLPQLVPQEQLTRVNAINSSIQSMVALVSPMLSAALFSMATIETIFFVDVITAAIAVSILLLFLPVSAHAKALTKQTTSYYADMLIGFGYIKNHDYLKAFLLFCALFFISVSPAAFLTPLQVVRSFGGDVWHLTAIEVTFSIGMILGGIIMTWWGGFKNKVHTMTLAVLIMGVCTMALGITPNFLIYLAFMGLSGIAMPIFNTPSMVLIQENVEESYLGRVFGILTMISSSMMPLGILVFGPMSDVIKIEWLLLGTGLLMFIQGFFLLVNKALLEVGNSLAKPQQAG
jgi:DHA3 family macrolide efflux protein-like MFS transporter